ncbi:methyl-accepting chemotaxis protein [Tissierella praeacuta]|uniref:methyl-accepting chemotaxis protein n=1 Tax=Tissierella praeacuta TaxID=43131 RepID=UPI00105169BA|nr:methyl-accepting chemotaxis protein [Tissierella praeacuta]TCU77240.1 methyl-accepting chemotaxis protein [Tissierella praeacuta]
MESKGLRKNLTKISRENTKKGSIKKKLILMPLLIVLIAIVGVTITSSYMMREGLQEEIKHNIEFISETVIERLIENQKTLEILDSMLEIRIRNVGKTVLENEDKMNNDLLRKISNLIQANEINLFNKEGRIICSTRDDNIGWVATEGHFVYDFIKNNEKETFEEIRKDVFSDNFEKNGYMKGSNGNFVQIGIAVNEIKNIEDELGYQGVIEDIMFHEEIIDVMLLNRDMEVIASSDKTLVGEVLQDEGSRIAAEEGTIHFSEYFHPEKKEKVYAISIPLIIEGNHMGALHLDYSVGDMQSIIYKNVITLSILSIIIFILLGIVLYRMSNSVVKTIDKLKEKLGFIASRDLSNPIPKDLMDQNNELGEISEAINKTQNAMKNVIQNILNMSGQVAAASQQLTATSEETAAAANEVAVVIEDIANGASEQAKDIEQGNFSILELGNLIRDNRNMMKELNTSVEKVNSLKDEGLEVLKDLVEKMDVSSNLAGQTQEAIQNTYESTEKIANYSEMIESISEQINLLSLNAAIEAARAGELGRGFAVVAEEIRKLAEESNKFTGEITNLINELTVQTRNSVNIMKESRQIVFSQTESVNTTNDGFRGIAEAIEIMRDITHKVSHSSDEMEQKKESIISIIENLSAISEENAAATQEASASVEEQTASMEEIANSSEELAKIAEDLDAQLRVFKL